jgi:hypothetical protein
MRESRLSADQAELADLLKRPSAPVAPSLAFFALEELLTAVRHWGDDPLDKRAAKVGGGFGPKACLAIEALTVMSLSRERTVACAADSELAHVVSVALRANQTPQNIPPAHANA